MADWGTRFRSSRSFVGRFRGESDLFLPVLLFPTRVSLYLLWFPAVLRFEGVASVVASDGAPNPSDLSKSSFFLFIDHISISPCPDKLVNQGTNRMFSNLCSSYVRFISDSCDTSSYLIID